MLRVYAKRPVGQNQDALPGDARRVLGPAHGFDPVDINRRIYVRLNNPGPNSRPGALDNVRNAAPDIVDSSLFYVGEQLRSLCAGKRPLAELTSVWKFDAHHKVGAGPVQPRVPARPVGGAHHHKSSVCVVVHTAVGLSRWRCAMPKMQKSRHGSRRILVESPPAEAAPYRLGGCSRDRAVL